MYKAAERLWAGLLCTKVAGEAGLEPTECQSQSLVPYQLGYSPICMATSGLLTFLALRVSNR